MQTPIHDWQCTKEEAVQVELQCSALYIVQLHCASVKCFALSVWCKKVEANAEVLDPSMIGGWGGTGWR